MKTLLDIIDLTNEPPSILSKMRIEINLTEEVSTALQTKAEELNHSRKSYIEFLCIKEALAKKLKRKRVIARNFLRRNEALHRTAGYICSTLARTLKFNINLNRVLHIYLVIHSTVY